MIYKPASGSSLSKEDAQRVGDVLESMGEFTPSDVVDAARPATSVLHPHFDWDDLRAAEKYRLVQARHLVNTITVVIQIDEQQVETKAFHSITLQTSEDVVEQRYSPIRIVSASEDRRSQVIEKAMQELEGWRTRYEQYKAVFGTNIFAAIDVTTKRVRKQKPRALQPAAPEQP